MQYRFISGSLIALFWFVFFFESSVVYATNKCCITPDNKSCHLETDFHPCSGNVGNISSGKICGKRYSGQEDTSCIDLSQRTRVSSEGHLCGTDADPGFLGNLAAGTSESRITNEVCLIDVPVEIEVSCTETAVCRDQLGASTDCSSLNNDRDLCLNNPNCFYNVDACYNRNDASICNRLSQRFCGTKSESGAIEGSLVCTWDSATSRCLTRVEQEMSSTFQYHDNSLLTPCAAKGNCRSVDDLLAILLKQTTIVFRLIGAAAFFFFVYGGFTIILSFGNSEKVQQGKQILTAAIVGIIIIFGAYILIKFILDTLGATGFASTLF